MEYVAELNMKNIDKINQITIYYCYWQILFKVIKNKALY